MTPPAQPQQHAPAQTPPHHSVHERDFVDALARGLAVLESFGPGRQRLNASQAADRAGLTRAAARRHLLTLTALGYLESDGHSFWLGPKVLRFGGSYLASARLPQLVQPVLDRLGALTQATLSVVVRDHDEVVIIARSIPPQYRSAMLAHGLHLGARLPLHATSTGRVLLAALSPAQLQQWLTQASAATQSLPRLTPHTQTQPDALAATLAQVRAQGYCLACNEHELGVCALAVPLHDARGHTPAALNIVTACTAWPSAQWLRENLALLLEAARQLQPIL